MFQMVSSSQSCKMSHICLGFDELSHSGIRRDLQNVRRVDWWTKFGKNVYPMMDQLASLFIWLRGEPHGRIIFFA